ncbi:MAG: TrmB family transcriptional regulator [Chloroflexi bacterium]|nr:MAG: TrmB family transcriptional regulator [Chloroflexota bacterium]MBL1193876.1 TrmB family transcriptional regulator [Chloroflexota bacterium]NOH11170.1 TrmB family transcriptional regulator [Chloroflexota bacterium]
MEWLEQLTTIGFTEYEAKAYLALLSENPATGYQISKNSGVPRSMIYEALGRLEARGAVLKKEERRSTLYRPIPPEVLLDRYEEGQMAVISDLRQGLNALYTAEAGDDYWTVKGHAATLSIASEMIDTAQDELMLVLDDPHISELENHLVDAEERGVKIETLLTGSGNLDVGAVAYHPPLESEAHGLHDMLVVVADGQQVLIASEEVDTTATITNNRNMVMIARQFVWMELFTQRINAHIGPDLLKKLSPQDQEILASRIHIETPTK